MPRVLGVDPGSYRTGWALLTGRADRPTLVDAGEIALDPRSPFPERLHALQVAIDAIVARLVPAAAAVEAPFHGASARSSLQLAHARGVVLAALAGGGVAVSEYAPATIKKAVTGSGRADKAQVQTMVRLLVGPGVAPDRPDLADAVAAALCHLALAPVARRLAAVGESSRSRGAAVPADQPTGRPRGGRSTRRT